MTNFEKTSLYDRMADFINIMDEDELRELAEVCNSKASAMEQSRRDCQRNEFLHILSSIINDAQDAGFSIEIKNKDNPDWIVQLMPNNNYSIKMCYVGK